MSDEIIDADDDWPETQTGGDGDSECDPIIVAGDDPVILDETGEDDRGQDDHELGEFGGER